MKGEFGEDAVILHTKRIKQGGFFGLFGRQKFEVIGAIDPDGQTRPSGQKAKESPPPYGKAGGESFLQAAPKKDVPLRDDPVQQSEEPHRHPGPSSASGKLWPESIRNVYRQLVDCDLPKETAQELLKKVLQTIPKHELHDLAKIWNHLNTLVASEIATVNPWEFDGTQKRAVLIGPTGVGKTTTIAKLAANFALVAGKNVGLITVDTYRIAAVDQLKAYADIIGVPIRIAYSPQDLTDALRAMEDRDLVLIDTAGRSHRNRMQMAELKTFLDGIDAEIHLVVSATTKDRDLSDIIHAFSGIDVDRLIVTKLDETSGFGILFQATNKTRAPIAFITTGQSVPEDIEVAEPEKITQMILGE